MEGEVILLICISQTFVVDQCVVGVECCRGDEVGDQDVNQVMSTRNKNKYHTHE